MLKNNRASGAVVIVLIAAMSVSTSHAQQPSSAHTLKLNEKATSPPASIADVSWIAGHRRASALGGLCEEVWTSPMGNAMVGMFRFVKDGKVVFYELMTIAEENKSLVLKIKHFNPDLSGWEEKDISQNFPLVKITPTEAFFSGQTYRRLEDGSLQLFVAMKQKTGELTETEFIFDNSATAVKKECVVNGGDMPPGNPNSQTNPKELKKITNIENAYPDWSPDGSRIVFQSNRTGKSQIYVMNADGSHVLRLTNNPASDAGPHFSPDGSKIAFDSDRDGDSEIYLMNADGTGEIRLTNNPADDSHPNWSPDGTRIIFDSSRDTPNPKADWWDQFHDLYSMKVDGTDVRKITNCRTVCTFGSWSPDGKKIAYRKVINTPGFYDDKNLTLSNTNSEVFVANSDGSNELNLSKSAAYDAWPSWSPDGTKILFGSNRAGVTQVYVVNIDGSHLTRLIDDRETDEDTRARWSRDGSKIAFTRTRKGTMDIYVLEVSQ